MKQMMSFAEFVETIAEKAGMTVNKPDDSSIVVHFDTGEGRTQRLIVKPVGQEGGNLIVGFYSAVLEMPAGQMLNQKTANELLSENAHLYHGAWAIEKIEDSEYLVVFDTQIAQTMDPEEFKASVRALAFFADEMEKKLGKDVF